MPRAVILKTWRQRAAALMMFYLGIVVMKHDEGQDHVDCISSIAMLASAPMSNVAGTATVSYSAAKSLGTGFVLPESRLHQIYISVG